MNIAPSVGLRCGLNQGQVQRECDPVVASIAVVAPAALPRRNAPQHALAGYSTTRIVMEFMRWAVERSEFPTMEAIVRHFGVSRATAYRWRISLGETYRLETLPPNEHDRFRIGGNGAVPRGTHGAGEA